MKAIVYTITLEEPLLATSLQGDPNSSISLPYLPGSMLRGALINQYIQQHGGTAALDPTRDEPARSLFFSGSTRYLPAYPINEHTRTLPTPRCLFYGKYVALDQAGNKIANLHHLDWTFEERRRCEQNPQHGDFKPLNTPFCVIDDDDITLCDPARTLTIHTQRDRRRGRATRDSGAIFRYEALAAGQSFQGVVLVDDDNHSQQVHTLLASKPIRWLGRSRSAHYGRVKLHVEHELTDWHEMGTSPADLAAATPHTLLLLSDTLLCTPQGQVAASVDADTLALALELPTGAVTIDPARSFSASVLQGGYNASAKLPLPQQPALAAGSLITFTLTQPLPTKAVQRLYEQGIGLRRAEGFGRIGLNPELPDKLVLQSNEPRRDDQSPDLPPAEQELAQTLAGRLAQTRREAAILTYLDTVQFAQLPAPSQLNELRTLVRSVRSSDDPASAVEQVQQRLQTMRQTARQQFKRARITDTTGTPQSLLKWINALLEPQDQSEQDPITSVLNLQQAKTPVAGQPPADPNWQHLALELLAGVLEKAARTAQQQDAQKGTHYDN